MAKSCKCKKGEECEECPEWIFTFADLVMLMMGFFVILFVLKPEGKKGATSNTQAARENSPSLKYREDVDSSPELLMAWPPVRRRRLPRPTGCG